jgi:protein-S-isoprenylcysteine O-methyltransferase Ste14
VTQLPYDTVNLELAWAKPGSASLPETALRGEPLAARMHLLAQLERQGQWLFKYRGSIGALILPLVAAALRWPGPPLSTWSDSAVDALNDIGLGVAVLGLALRAATVGFVPAGTSGRNAREQRAHALNTSGAYSLLRHPLYLANAVIMLGFGIGVGSLWFLAVLALAYALFIERIIAAEEQFLAQQYGAEHGQWAAQTPAFWPALARWHAPQMGFSLRTVLRREYNGCMGVALAFFALELARDVGVGQEPLLEWLQGEPQWWVVLVAGMLVFVLLRTLKRATRLLHIDGR